MGKDQNGVYHPGKGKPSGVNKQEGLGIHPTSPEKMEEYIEITEKYTIDDDELDPSVPMRHPNRNTSKEEGRVKGKLNNDESNKSENGAMEEPVNAATPPQLPGVLTRDNFTELANYTGECCISLFIPVREAGVEVNEHFDVTKFKSVLQQIALKLKDKGLDHLTIERLLQPGQDLIKDDAFWKDMSPGLAVFIADGMFKYIKMPVACDEELIIESSFFVTPLIPLMRSREYFYLLTISKHGCKLFKADAFGMQRVPVELPGSIDEVKRLSDLDATTHRSGESGRRATPAATRGSSHGDGGGTPDDKDNIATYFEAVDDILWDKVFNKENAPLMLAGVEYLIPIYKDRCDYHNVWPESLTGSRDRQDTQELYKEAKELIQPYFDQPIQRALETYGNNSATGLTSSIIDDIIPAAYYSRISHLFVARGEHIWGTFSEIDNKLTVHADESEGGENLIDNAVVKTLANGGEVFLLYKERMPAESPIAALMRY